MSRGRRSPDLFNKCVEFHTRAEYARELGHPANPRMLEALGLYPFFIPIDDTAGTEVTIEGRRLLMIGSNNYLGMTTHPRVRAAATAAIEAYGTGCTGSRFLNGTLELHRRLERELASFVGKESALAFSTGYQANVGIITALLGDGDLVVADRESHASIIDGIRMAQGRVEVRARFFKHNDPTDLERILASEGGPALVIVEGVYSITGELSPLPAIVEVCTRHRARLLVDDAHGLGVLGQGRGSAVHHGCLEGVDLVMGTFSKSFASCGGFVAGPREVIHWIQHFARSFMFSASLPPANAATVIAVIDVIREEPQIVERVVTVSQYMRNQFAGLGYEVGESYGAIVPLIIGDQFRAVQAWRQVFDEGVYTNAVLPPAVPARRSALRTSYMADHSEQQLQFALDVFSRLRGRLLPRRRRGRVVGGSPPLPD